MKYKATTEQNEEFEFETGKGDMYAVYISTKWAVKHNFDLLEVTQFHQEPQKWVVVFDKDN